MTEVAILTIPLLPLAAFLLNGLFGRWLKEIGGWIAVIAMIVAATLSSMLFVSAWIGKLELPVPMDPMWDWMAAGPLKISIGFHFDALTAVMCFVITFVGSLVFLYSIGYMAHDPGFSRFFAYLSLFVFSMLILVLADSFPLMFVGWEGVGLCSYLLIGYYMEMRGAPEAGMKAFVVNRIGDFGFLLAMFLVFKHFGSLEIADVVHRAPDVFSYDAAGVTAVTAITLFLLLGCAGKSAQIPLFVWLPDAMAGPTPVSALIHAATMVTAGVYLVARTSVLFALSPVTMAVMAGIGAATAFVAGTIALTQRDIKKVLAYSTVSQLGYMFLACGCGAFAIGIFHVFTHAFFKACLFLGAGAVIHACGGVQDLFQMGGLKKPLRTTYLTYAIACFAIAGFPLTAGFFSKDEILWYAFSASPEALRGGGVPWLYLVGIATALMTAIYSFRALYIAFHGESRLPEHARHHIHSPHWTMHAALIILAAGSLLVGFLNVPGAMADAAGIGHGDGFHHFLGGVVHEAEAIIAANAPGHGEGHSRALELGLAAFSAALAIVGIFIARKFFLAGWPNAGDAFAARHPLAYQISRGGWWWDLFCTAVVARALGVVARFSVWIDRTLIDGALHGVGRVAREASRGIRNMQMGQVQAYALAVLAGANILLFVILVWS